MPTSQSQQELIDKLKAVKRHPVGVAKQGFSLATAKQLHTTSSVTEMLKGGDLMMYAFLNWSEFMPTSIVSRTGPVKQLKQNLRPEVGEVSFDCPLGNMSLNALLDHPQSFAQGYLVIHKGQVVFEQYPGMRPYDNHVLASTTKVMAALAIELLIDDGLIEDQQNYSHYVPDFADTDWADLQVIDLLDMATGLDLVESEATRSDSNSTAVRLFLAEMGEARANGVTESMTDVLKSAKKSREPGTVFEYSSAVTQALVLLAEAVSGLSWAEFFQQRVWSKMGVEGDMQVHLSPDGTALSHGLLSTRLADLGRYGMQYTPSWHLAAHERIVSDAMLARMQSGGRPHLNTNSDMNVMMTEHFHEEPSCNSRQWDAVFSDGDMYKAGLMGQGLYVSPSKDLSIVWFSASPEYVISGFSRAIANSGLFDA